MRKKKIGKKKRKKRKKSGERAATQYKTRARMINAAKHGKKVREVAYNGTLIEAAKCLFRASIRAQKTPHVLDIWKFFLAKTSSLAFFL